MTLENDGGLRPRRSRFPSVTVNTLKIAGAILITLYFFGAAVIQNGILHVNSYTPEQLNDFLAGDASAIAALGGCLWAESSSTANMDGDLS